MIKSRRTLSKEKILAAATAYADLNGIETLSMRKLADELHVKAMSLYNHIKNKEQLIDEMVDAVAEKFTIPAKGIHWRDAMEERARSMNEILKAHPWAALTILPRVMVGPHYLTFLDRTLSCLFEAGFSIPSADWAINAIDTYIYGFVIHQLTFPLKESEYQDSATEYLPHIDKEEYPGFFAISQMVSTGRYNGKLDFNFGLKMILDGLEQHMENATGENSG